MPVRFSQLEGRRVGVWGAGRETASLASQMRSAFGERPTVLATDSRVGAEAGEGISDVEVGGDDIVSALSHCEIVVRSPGVSVYRTEVRELRERGIPVVTATGLWLAEPRRATVVGITGTKGKSTTASLTAHLLRAGGMQVALAGNIGLPAIDLLGRPEPDCYVIELSSYQIADLECGVDIALFTNLYPEHVDWHGSSEQYFADKLRLAALKPVRGVAVNECNDRLRACHEIRQRLPYGCAGRYRVVDNDVLLERDVRLPVERAGLRGEHNALNLCGALTIAHELGLAIPSIEVALRDFAPLPHRLEPLGERHGVEWINDSISTTPESTIAALRSLADRPLVLIGGGFERQQNYVHLGAELADRDAVVIGLPETGARLLEAARLAGVPVNQLISVRDLDAAVAEAIARATPTGVVLLSPAAASFGQFESFEERGKRFAELAGFPERSNER